MISIAFFVSCIFFSDSRWFFFRLTQYFPPFVAWDQTRFLDAQNDHLHHTRRLPGCPTACNGEAS